MTENLEDVLEEEEVPGKPYLHQKELSAFGSVQEAMAGVLWAVATDNGTSTGWFYFEVESGPAKQVIEALKNYNVVFEANGTFRLKS